MCPGFLVTAVPVFGVGARGPGSRFSPCACTAFCVRNLLCTVSALSLSLLWDYMLNVFKSFIIILLLISFSHTSAVCTSCFGSASTCAGATATCPWVVGLTSNIAVISAGKGVLQLTGLLPNYLLQLFTRPVLEAIHALTLQPKDGVPFSFAGASFSSVRLAVASGWVSANEALVEWSDRMDLLDLSAAHYDSQLKILQTQISLLSLLPSGLSSSSGGVFRFILSKLSGFVCKKASSFSLDVCHEVEPPGGSSSRSLTFQASLVRPSSIEQLCSLLTLFVLVCVRYKPEVRPERQIKCRARLQKTSLLGRFFLLRSSLDSREGQVSAPRAGSRQACTCA